jgi:hypothetical protein
MLRLRMPSDVSECLLDDAVERRLRLRVQADRLETQRLKVDVNGKLSPEITCIAV